MAGAGSGGLVLDLRALLTETHHIKYVLHCAVVVLSDTFV